MVGESPAVATASPNPAASVDSTFSVAKPEPITLAPEKYLAAFDVGELLGAGAHGHVYAATHRETGEPLAIKVMLREEIGKHGQVLAKREVSALMKLGSHPQIVKFHSAMANKETICVTMERVAGGGLFGQLGQVAVYTERLACRVVRNLLRAIAHVHSKGYVHRDIKPDNVLLVEPLSAIQKAGAAAAASGDAVSRKELAERLRLAAGIRLADFGLSVKLKPGHVLVETLGTPHFLAPEIIEAGLSKTAPGYGQACDLWSTGVLTYVLLCGSLPFNRRTRHALFEAIRHSRPDIVGGVWGHVSYDAKDFVLKLLNRDPADRLTAEQALKHPWIANIGGADDDDAEAPPQPVETPASQVDSPLPGVAEKLKHFAAAQRFRAAVFGAEAALRLQYLGACAARRAKPNTDVVETLTMTAERVRVVDLSRNYVGRAALVRLIDVLSTHSEVEEVNLTDCQIDDAIAADIVDVIRKNTQVLPASPKRLARVAESDPSLLKAAESMPADAPSPEAAHSRPHTMPGADGTPDHSTAVDNDSSPAVEREATTTASETSVLGTSTALTADGSRALRRVPFRRLILDGNPITHATGRKLLALVQAGRYVDAVSVKNTPHVSESIKRKLDLAAAANERRAAAEFNREASSASVTMTSPAKTKRVRPKTAKVQLDSNCNLIRKASQLPPVQRSNATAVDTTTTPR